MTAGMMAHDDDFRKKLESPPPIGFPGKPIDVAYVVLYLASDEARLVTGAEFVVVRCLFLAPAVVYPVAVF